MKFIDQINRDLDKLSDCYAHGNAHGIPNSKGIYQLDNLKQLPPIELNMHTPKFLIRLAEILDKYY
ncbi:MAG: hypothetical protein ACXADY_23135 [Candidatus Hodarchaeales archaeon]|jgi:hypothetical protein